LLESSRIFHEKPWYSLSFLDPSFQLLHNLVFLKSVYKFDEPENFHLQIPVLESMLEQNKLRLNISAILDCTFELWVQSNVSIKHLILECSPKFDCSETFPSSFRGCFASASSRSSSLSPPWSSSEVEALMRAFSSLLELLVFFRIPIRTGQDDLSRLQCPSRYQQDQHPLSSRLPELTPQKRSSALPWEKI